MEAISGALGRQRMGSQHGMTILDLVPKSSANILTVCDDSYPPLQLTSDKQVLDSLDHFTPHMLCTNERTTVTCAGCNTIGRLKS